MGPSCMDVFNTLLRRLRVAIEESTPASAGKFAFDSELASTIVENFGTLAFHLSVHQKVWLLTRLAVIF